MKKLGFVLILVSALAMAQAGDPPGFHVWSKTQILQMSNELHSQMDATKFKSETIATEGNHRFLLAHREGPGQSEYHATESDIMFIESGHATLIYGGTMVDAKDTAPNEQRGTGIKGGMEKPLSPGDVVAIPPKTPHQVRPRPGETFDYFVVKVTQ